MYFSEQRALPDISSHAVVVFGLGKNFLFKSILGRCGNINGANYQINEFQNKNCKKHAFKPDENMKESISKLRNNLNYNIPLAKNDSVPYLPWLM